MIRITPITRGYACYADRERAITQLSKRGFDHFVRYRDTQAQHALCFGRYEREVGDHPTTKPSPARPSGQTG